MNTWVRLDMIQESAVISPPYTISKDNPLHLRASQRGMLCIMYGLQVGCDQELS